MSTTRRRSRTRTGLPEPWSTYARGLPPPAGYVPCEADREDFIGIEFFQDLYIGEVPVVMQDVRDHPHGDAWLDLFA